MKVFSIEYPNLKIILVEYEPEVSKFSTTILLNLSVVLCVNIPFSFNCNEYPFENCTLILTIFPLCLLTPLGFWGFVVSAGVAYVANIIVGIVFFLMNNLRDSGGNYVR